MGLMETATKTKKFNLDPRLILVDARKDSMTLSWPAVDNATRYILDIRQVADGENPNKDHEAEFDRISENIKSTQIRKRNLEAETEYFFRVAPVVFDKKKNKNKRGEWITHKEPFVTLSESQEDDFSMLPPIVTVPVDSNSLMITWEEVQEEIYGFELQMREHKGGARWFGSQQLATTDDGTIKNEVQRFNLTSKYGYQFRVRPVTDYDEPFSPPSDPVVPRIGQNNAQYYSRTPLKPQPKEEEAEQEYGEEYDDDDDDYEEDENTWYYRQDGSDNGKEYDDDDDGDYNDDEEEEYYADEYARKSAPAPKSATFRSRRRKNKDDEEEVSEDKKCPPPWFKSADTPGSILICWKKLEGSIGYELQMKELHYELRNKKMEDYSGDWKTIAPCLQGTQVKKKNLTSPFGYQFRVRPVNGPKSNYFSEPSNPVILPGASSTQRGGGGGGRQDRNTKSTTSSMPAPWFKSVPGGEKHAIMVCWQPQSDVAGYELQMREVGGSSNSNDDNQAWTTIANNLKGTQVKKKNLTNPNGYQFRVRPVDGPNQHKGYSPPSSTAIAK